MKTTARRTVAMIGAGAVMALVPTAAHADTFNIDYDVVGTTHIASTDNDIALGPTTLSTAIDSANGNISGHLPLPATRAKFQVLGLLPVTADVAFQEAAPVTGHIDIAASDALVQSTASYYIRLSNIKVAGLPTVTGAHCRTIDPVTIPANTPAGESFSLIEGGTLAGEYTIGNFQNCGLNTLLINALIPGSGNTAEIEVTNGRFVG
ncbi:MAG: hypothetical protein JWR55_471 [Aeromicrobium sp.]|nr:hypothetical protein [Aeromicrobium sp.]